MVRQEQTNYHQQPVYCIDHFVELDLNRFFLHYLSCYPKFWTKPFLCRFFFYPHAPQMKLIILQELFSHIIRSSSVSSTLHLHQVSFKLISFFIWFCKGLGGKFWKKTLCKEDFLFC